MKKKVLFVIPTLRIGGAEKSLVTLLKALDNNRLEITLFLFEEGGPLQKEVPEYIRIISADTVTRAMMLEFRYYFKDLLTSFHFRAAISRLYMMLHAKYCHKKRFNWKTISKFVPKLEEYFDVAVGYLEGVADFYVIDKVNASKKIGWIHSDLSKRELLPIEKEYYSKFDSLVTISDVCAKAVNSFIPSKKAFILENMIQKEEIIKKSQINIDWDDNMFHIITVGRIEYVKGIDLAFEAAKILKQSSLSFQWHVFGKGSLLEEFQKIITNQDADSFFVLEGETINPYPYIRRADILVQPSRIEGKSIVLDEAKLLGKAIVVTNYPSVTDQIEERITGLIAEMNPESISEKIIELILNSDLKKTLECNCEKEKNKSMRTLDKFYQLIDCEE